MRRYAGHVPEACERCGQRMTDARLFSEFDCNWCSVYIDPHSYPARTACRRRWNPANWAFASACERILLRSRWFRISTNVVLSYESEFRQHAEQIGWGVNALQHGSNGLVADARGIRLAAATAEIRDGMPDQDVRPVARNPRGRQPNVQRERRPRGRPRGRANPDRIRRRGNHGNI